MSTPNPYGSRGVQLPGYMNQYLTQILSNPFAYTTPAKPSAEFSGNEFAAGVVTGARSFDVDRLGRLTGVSYKTVWRPGEVHAKCLGYDGSIRDAAAEALGEENEHNLGSCVHGFYAYYDGSTDYYVDGYVNGVIEGYGETVIGTRGFRCMKARIVALHIPKSLPDGTRKIVARNYAEIPQFDSFKAMIAAFPTDDAGQGVSPANDPDFWTRSV